MSHSRTAPSSAFTATVRLSGAKTTRPASGSVRRVTPSDCAVGPAVPSVLPPVPHPASDAATQPTSAATAQFFPLLRFPRGALLRFPRGAAAGSEGDGAGVDAEKDMAERYCTGRMIFMSTATQLRLAPS